MSKFERKIHEFLTLCHKSQTATSKHLHAFEDLVKDYQKNYSKESDWKFVNRNPFLLISGDAIRLNDYSGFFEILQHHDCDFDAKMIDDDERF